MRNSLSGEDFNEPSVKPALHSAIDVHGLQSAFCVPDSCVNYQFNVTFCLSSSDFQLRSTSRSSIHSFNFFVYPRLLLRPTIVTLCAAHTEWEWLIREKALGVVPFGLVILVDHASPSLSMLVLLVYSLHRCNLIPSGWVFQQSGICRRDELAEPRACHPREAVRHAVEAALEGDVNCVEQRWVSLSESLSGDVTARIGRNSPLIASSETTYCYSRRATIATHQISFPFGNGPPWPVYASLLRIDSGRLRPKWADRNVKHVKQWPLANL